MSVTSAGAANQEHKGTDGENWVTLDTDGRLPGGLTPPDPLDGLADPHLGPEQIAR